MRKIAALFILLGVIMGCRSPFTDVPSTTNDYASPVGQPAANDAASIATQYPLKYTKSLNAEPLTKMIASENSDQLKTEAIHNDYKVLIYKKNDDEGQIYAALQYNNGTYEIGQIGYEGASDYTASTINVMGQSYVKVTGSVGANAPISSYVSLRTSPPTVLHIEANTVEADVDLDGVNEIVAAVGTAAETSIYKIEHDSLVSVNLNELLDAVVVMYLPESNTFEADIAHGEMSQWKIEGHLITKVMTLTNK